MTTLEAFIADPANEGHIGTNEANFGECVGLVQKWFALCGEPFFYGHAKDLFANAPAESYTKGGTWPAPAGAAIVVDGRWGRGYGHTGISLGDGRVYEQNNPAGSTPHITHYQRPAAYVGYILPNNYQGGEVVNPAELEDLKAWKARATAPGAVIMQQAVVDDLLQWKQTGLDLKQKVIDLTEQGQKQQKTH